MDSFGSLLSNETKWFDDISWLGEQKIICEREQNPVLTGFGKILVLACISKVESRERHVSMYIDRAFFHTYTKYVCAKLLA